ncbi:MAG: hypothetical protein ABSF93_18495 [Candidatus Sulfotelmatobacter sp.]|jgi:hypothetical protein
MTDTVENLILDLLEWVGRKERSYQETMDAWRTSSQGFRSGRTPMIAGWWRRVAVRFA